jgi:hypothetical protein
MSESRNVAQCTLTRDFPHIRLIVRTLNVYRALSSVFLPWDLKNMAKQSMASSLRQMVRLLQNPDFLHDASAVNRQIRLVSERALSQSDWDSEWPSLSDTILRPFLQKWGVVPPVTELLNFEDPNRSQVLDILSGRMGLIPVFPCTTQKEVIDTARKLRKLLHKTRSLTASRRKALMASWLRDQTINGKRPGWSEIAAVVWGRTKGLKLPTIAATVRRLSVGKETALYKRCMAQGLSPSQTMRAVYRLARGSEAPASAMVRMAEARLREDEERLTAALQNPEFHDRLGFCLTLLLKECISEHPVLGTVVRLAFQVRDALITSSLPH